LSFLLPAGVSGTTHAVCSCPPYSVCHTPGLHRRTAATCVVAHVKGCQAQLHSSAHPKLWSKQHVCMCGRLCIRHPKGDCVLALLLVLSCRSCLLGPPQQAVVAHLGGVRAHGH
jgi:hypothetical protein